MKTWCSKHLWIYLLLPMRYTSLYSRLPPRSKPSTVLYFKDFQIYITLYLYYTVFQKSCNMISWKQHDRFILSWLMTYILLNSVWCHHIMQHKCENRWNTLHYAIYTLYIFNVSNVPTYFLCSTNEFSYQYKYLFNLFYNITKYLYGTIEYNPVHAVANLWGSSDTKPPPPITKKYILRCLSIPIMNF